MIMTKYEIFKELEKFEAKTKKRSQWKKGVIDYAYDLLENLEDGKNYSNETELEKALLGGAECWTDYSWEGFSLCYDSQIVKRLCTPSQLKRYDYGNKCPSKWGEWLDVQTLALIQAFYLIVKLQNKKGGF